MCEYHHPRGVCVYAANDIVEEDNQKFAGNGVVLKEAGNINNIAHFSGECQSVASMGQENRNLGSLLLPFTELLANQLHLVFC